MMSEEKEQACLAQRLSDCRRTVHPVERKVHLEEKRKGRSNHRISYEKAYISDPVASSRELWRRWSHMWCRLDSANMRVCTCGDCADQAGKLHSNVVSLLKRNSTGKVPRNSALLHLVMAPGFLAASSYLRMCWWKVQCFQNVFS